MQFWNNLWGIKNSPLDPHLTLNFPISTYPNYKNYIRTTKYTLLTFLPLNLYFQVPIALLILVSTSLQSLFLGGCVICSIRCQQFRLWISNISISHCHFIRSRKRRNWRLRRIPIRNWQKRYLADKSANTIPVTAIRNGKPVELLAQNLVPGDLIYMEKGEKASADASKTLFNKKSDLVNVIRRCDIE